MAAGDAISMRNLGCHYNDGDCGLRQNYRKAMKLWLRAGELGDAIAYNNIGYAYHNGDGVERDTKKGKYYWELAAMGGSVFGRHSIGVVEYNAGNFDRAVKHYMVSAAAGHDESLKAIRDAYTDGHVTRDEFEKALRAHKETKDEMRSDQRDAAAKYFRQN